VAARTVTPTLDTRLPDPQRRCHRDDAAQRRGVVRRRSFNG